MRLNKPMALRRSGLKAEDGEIHSEATPTEDFMDKEDRKAGRDPVGLCRNRFLFIIWPACFFQNAPLLGQLFVM